MNEQKMFHRIEEYLQQEGMDEGVRALYFMEEIFQGKRRRDNQPVSTHPLWMANYGISLGIHDQALLEVILLHDVVEDNDISLEELPFCEEVREGVKYMTITIQPGETKEEAKTRYYRSLIDNEYALVTKGLDRLMNLFFSAGIMSTNSVQKNLYETQYELLPVLKEGKTRYPQYADVLYVIIAGLRGIAQTLSALYEVDLDACRDTEGCPGTDACSGAELHEMSIEGK